MNRRTLHRIGLVAAIAAAVPLAFGGLALGEHSDPPNVTARGTSEQKIKSRGSESFDVVMQTITIPVGGNSGWHSHPGQAIVVIKSGNFTTYDGDDKTCSPHVYTAGDVYVDHGYGDVHIARNEGSVPTEAQVTYLDVPVHGAFRIAATSPGNCPF